MHLLSTSQIKERKHLMNFFEVVNLMSSPWQYKIDPLYQARGKIMGIVKDEPSTRTRISFEVSMKRLGGEVINLPLETSSVTKGETLEDTIRTLSEYVDVIVLRYSKKGGVTAAAKAALVPIINAGDGDGEHPTQALLDSYTIYKHFGSIDNKKIMLVGDCKYSRTIHSLIYLISLFRDISLYLVCPEGLELPEYYMNHMRGKGIVVETRRNIKEDIDGMDVVYMTRLQKERYKEGEGYKDLILEKGGIKGIIMHPLPRCGEIPVEFDCLPNAFYWKQVKNGLYVRMALLYNLFNKGVLL